MADGDQTSLMGDLVKYHANRLIILSETKLNQCAQHLLNKYGAVKKYEESSDGCAAFVEFECEHAAHLIARCFEYVHVPLYLKHVPCSLSTKALKNHFTEWNSGRDVTIHRPDITNQASSVVVVELTGVEAAEYHQDRMQDSSISDNGKEFRFSVIPQVEQLTNSKRIFEQDGCYKCNLATFRNAAWFEDRIRKIDPYLTFLGYYLLMLIDKQIPPVVRSRFWKRLISPLSFIANTIDPYYRWNHDRRIVKDVNGTMQDAMEKVDSDGIVDWTRFEVKKALRGRPVAQVLIFGNGPFERLLDDGSVQLAFALRVAESYPSAPIYFQEPVMTRNEGDWLEGRGVRVRSGLSMKPPKMEENDACRIIFCIGNMVTMIEELLRSEWKSGGTARYIIVSADWGGKTEDGATEEEVAYVEQHYCVKLPAVREFFRKAEVVELPKFEPFPDALESMCLVYLPEKAELAEYGSVVRRNDRNGCTIL